MKHSSLSKSKYTSYNVGSVNKLFKPSELNFKIPSNASTLNVDKETKLPSGTFRPGATLNVPKNKYKTSKNSRKLNFNF